LVCFTGVYLSRENYLSGAVNSNGFVEHVSLPSPGL
jgi:hypothetical protein